jgi:hypothetical protein
VTGPGHCEAGRPPCPNNSKEGVRIVELFVVEMTRVTIDVEWYHRSKVSIR